MQLLSNLYLVGGPSFFLSDPQRRFGDCNVFAVKTEDGVVLIDCGYDQESLRTIDQNLQYWGMDPQSVRYVLLTHSHYDHSGNAKALQDRGAKIVAHHTVADALAKGDERTIHYAFFRTDFPRCQVDVTVGKHDFLRVGTWTFEAINVPGHTEGNMVYLTECDGRKVMFVGDFVFHERPLTVDSTLAWNGGTEVNTDQFIDSLLRMQQIRVDALLPGHGGFLMVNGSTIVDKGLVLALRAWGNKYADKRGVSTGQPPAEQADE